MSVARMMQMAAAGSAGAGPEPSGWTDPDLGNASYDSVSFSVAGQDTAPTGLFFKPDGLKMYVSGSSSDAVYQYTLSTAWDVSTSSYDSVSLSVSGQAGQPYIQFGDNGSKLYVSDNTSDAIYQYSLSTAWDISTASYDSVSFSVSGQDTVPQGIFFKPDGTKLYLVGFLNDSVFQYTLSTAWDLSSISYDSVSFSFLTQETQGRSLFFSPDGTKLFIVGTDGDTAYQYSLSTAWDISTASYDSVSFSVASQETVPLGLFFKSDGSKMYIVGSGSDTIYQYSTVTPAAPSWTDPDLANASYDSVSFSVAGQDSTPVGLAFSDDGSKMFMMGLATDNVYQYTLSTAWDVSSASYDSVSFSITQFATQYNISFKYDGTEMYVVGGSVVGQYSLSTAWDLSSASHSYTLDISAQTSVGLGAFVSYDGNNLYVAEAGSDSVLQYSLSTAYDLSSASYVQSLSVGSQETIPRMVFVSPDGFSLFLIGSGGDEVNEYSLATAWDISTASHVQFFSVSSQATNPLGFTFKVDGSKMYVVDQQTTTIYQYSTA